MVLDKLGSRFKDILNKLAKSIFVDDKLVDDLVREIQRALLQADVNVKLVSELTKSIKEKVVKAKSKLDKRTYLVNVVYDELVKFLGDEKSELVIAKKKPFKIMMVGVYGSGKTTTIGKLCNYYKKRGYKVATLGLDVHRPAAVDQIEQICSKINVDCYTDRKEKNPVKIYNEFEDKYSKYDILFIDTAGRDSLDEELVKEIKELNDKIKPDEKLLVLSADIGQAAQGLAEGFHKNCGVTGVIVSKLDGTAKAGGSLTGTAATGAKIKFIGVGEKIDDLETFNPKGFVSRLLGMGDLEALLEKAKDVIDEEKAGDMKDRLVSGDFDLNDLYEQMKAMKKMGPLNKIMDMVPGLSGIKLPKEALQVQEGKLERWKYIIDSCTKKERNNPDLIDSKRAERIANGSGTTVGEVRELIKQYRMAKKMMKMMKGKDPEKLMKKMGKFKLK
ncbi:signal recognition particle receptor subunit alpha [Candidatus Woesearchaeota archaeon]|nr:signal recognition particle receptor subunit alpha [Candidatus Woesearchaeota archaeon]